MNPGRTTRDALAGAAIALMCGAAVVSPVFAPFHGLSIDILTALRWQMFGNRPTSASTPAVVVAIDEETYQIPPFKGSPTLTWTGEIGRVVNAVIEGGAAVVGFDMVFPVSIEQSEIPFGEATLGEKVRGFDREFLRALAAGSAAGKVVLGEVLRNNQPIRPSPGQRVAIRQQRNIRALNVYTDPDDVVRRVPLTFSVDQTTVPSMALELASRALNTRPDIGGDGTVALAGHLVPGEVANTMTLNFAGGADDIPTYSFADLSVCASNGKKDFFREQFDGKVVILGTVLVGEDRRLTSKRFATGIEGSRAPRCALSQQATTEGFNRREIAGIYIHATAVNNLMTGDSAIEFGRWPIFLIATLAAAFAALMARIFKPVTAALAFVAAGALGVTGATATFNHALVLPLSEPFVAGLAALIFMVGYRFIVADKDRRLLQKSFAFYLAPGVIDRMLTSNRLPELGGETRDVTILFSDVANFSRIAENMAPHALTALMNEYLSAMTDIIEGHGGYVDKYIGDSIVAIFGAPANDPDHASHAAHAALDCGTRLAELNKTAAAFQGHPMAQRIGINSGEAVVGNFGSRRRFNYSVMGDAVNVAARLEGINKFYGTTVIASDTTVALTGKAFAWRELDAVRVKGRAQPLTIYELLEISSQSEPSRDPALSAYAKGLAHWRAGEFASAAGCFERAAETDPPSKFFLDRARAYSKNPPDGKWDPVRTLQEK